jgi:diacylglycerol kinase family enzyme
VLQEYAGWIAVAAIVVVLLLAWAIAVATRSEHTGIRVALRRRRRPPRSAFGERSEVAPKRAGIVVNPSKFDDLAQVKSRIVTASRQAGWAEPLFLETTKEDPGTGQARRAVTAHVDLVCPLGGDGTVRAVAEALAGTETPMGLLPGGTSNLLARNLQLPVDSLENALEVAMTGQNLRIDVGRLTVRRQPSDPEPPDEHPEGAPDQASGDRAEASVGDEAETTDSRSASGSPGSPSAEQPDQRTELGDADGQADDQASDDEGMAFLVMAGLGLDAAIMADASEQMKSKVGWPAYFVSGLKNMLGPQFKVSFATETEPPITRRTRTVIIGNCGRLVGGLTLMPEAEITDGQLDAVIISPKGIVGWAAVLGRVLTRRRKGHERLDYHTSPAFRVTADRPQEVQVDGETIGKAVGITATVQPRALTVRVGGH